MAKAIATGTMITWGYLSTHAQVRSSLLGNMNFEWGGTAGDTCIDDIVGVDIDAQGNVYVVGNFSGPADVDINPFSQFIVGTQGENGAFISKYSPQGQHLWTQTIVPPMVRRYGVLLPIGGVTATDIAVSPAGHVWVTGHFIDTVRFAGITKFSFHGIQDGFALLLNSNGQFIAFEQFLADTSSAVRCYTIDVDTQGNAYVAGTFHGKCWFGKHFLYSLGLFTYRMFYAKITPSPTVDWAFAIGNGSNDIPYDITVDDHQNALYITGTFLGTVDFDPSPRNANAVGLNDPFIAKYHLHSGQFQWVRYFSKYTRVNNPILQDNFNAAAAVSPTQNAVYFIANHYDTIEFYGGQSNIGRIYPPPNPPYGTFYYGILAKITPNGDLQWVTRIEGRNNSRDPINGALAYDVQTDLIGNPYVLGGTGKFVRFSKNYSMTNYFVFGPQHFVVQFDPQGHAVWMTTAKGAPTTGNALQVDSCGNVYAVGNIQQRPSHNSTRLWLHDSNNNYDLQRSLYLYAHSTTTAKTDGFLYKISMDTCAKCIPVVTQCPPYTSPSGLHQWTQSGVYYDTLGSSLCPFIRRVVLAVQYPFSKPVSAGFHYECDTICPGHLYELFPQPPEGGIYSMPGPSYVYVDSSSSPPRYFLKTSPIQAGWLTFYFTYTSPSGCTFVDSQRVFIDTSEICEERCPQLRVRPLPNNPQTEPIVRIHPNPAQDFLVVDIQGTFPSQLYTIEIYDLLGRKVKEVNIRQSQYINIADLPKGLYFITQPGKNQPLLIRKQ